jgi:hypothetical protein
MDARKAEAVGGVQILRKTMTRDGRKKILTSLKLLSFTLTDLDIFLTFYKKIS